MYLTLVGEVREHMESVGVVGAETDMAAQEAITGSTLVAWFALTEGRKADVWLRTI